jgi:urocanate hydratase
MVRNGELSAPIVIGRDHLDSGSVASPEPRDRSDEGWFGRRVRLATAQRPAQHRVRCHLGFAASRRRRRHGLFAALRHGDLRRRYRKKRIERIERVLWNDPATGVMRHADAGYEIAIDCAKEKGLNLPMITGSK